MKSCPAAFAIASVIGFGALVVAQTLPTVDLGYGVWQATLNETGSTYSFSNIRYAQPPIGNLRFQAPVAPTGVNTTVNDGQTYQICPQAAAFWGEVTEYYLEGADQATLEQLEAEIPYITAADLPAPGATENEDCLFLDVVVPTAVFDNSTSGAPVVVWIYGGGYASGSKDEYDPAGLIFQSQVSGNPGIIYVAFNYRLGMFGWLSGPTFAESGLPNAALYDQRLALEWVQANIHLFGGDATRVTVMGESAGAGSILHQITAYGGANGSAPFAQAISQSAAFNALPTAAEQEGILDEVFSAASTITNSTISTIAQLIALPSSTLLTINSLVVTKSVYGTYTFGPAVDGTFVPQLPGLLLLEGKFDTNLTLLIGHNSEEGIEFTNPLIQTATDFYTFLEDTLPTASADVLEYLNDTVYPDILDGSAGPYDSEYTRAAYAISEVAFNCNSYYLAHAFLNETYNYYFTIPPGLHGEDVPYTFFNGDTTTSDDGLAVQAAVAQQLQAYITNFVISGDPNVGQTVPEVPTYGSNSTVVSIDISGDAALVVDPLASGNCAWWQLALYA